MTHARSPGAMNDARDPKVNKAKQTAMTKLMCMINRHRPTRSAIQWEGTCYIASCKRCGEKIVRYKGRPWRKR
ncbi:hypothetical protein GGR39_003361 [Novosphingobium fluoreni]|uniref:Uncharacterized protein n=1 Tax=Novosphingobium fluoreni TaxID=1391222 RepID=A0A7W6C6X1_9SPHN|nr:hypothetical protein [Novosphingobium fluoreni]